MKSIVQRVKGLFGQGYGARSNSRIYFDWARKDPRWVLMFALARFETVRRLAAAKIRPNGTPAAPAASLFPDVDVERAVGELKRDGFCAGLDIGADHLSEILGELRDVPCFADPYEDQVFHLKDREAAEKRHGRTFVRAGYAFKDVACPSVRRLANDPKLMAIAAGYIGVSSPVPQGQIYWNFVPQIAYNPSDIAQAFHFDIDDYRALRLFVYLTDVDETAGPHVLIKGSHTKKRLRHRLPLGFVQSDEILIDDYGKDNVVTITGKAGTAFFEDTFAWHKGTPPTGRDRLLLAIVYKRNAYDARTEASLEAIA